MTTTLTRTPILTPDEISNGKKVWDSLTTLEDSGVLSDVSSQDLWIDFLSITLDIDVETWDLIMEDDSNNDLDVYSNNNPIIE